MALKKEKKTEIIEKLKDIFKKSPSVAFVNFHKLSVTDTGEMRSALREQGVGYFVTKKTLIRRTLTDSKIEGQIPPLEGELALAYMSTGEDVIAPARGVAEFAKKYKNKLSILGGVFDGRIMDSVEMTGIANIPPIEILYGQFVNVINSPIQGLAVALNEIAKSKE